jgi:hypothetical protein
MSIRFFNNERARLEQPYVTVDTQGRLYLNKYTQELFGCVNMSCLLLVGYDPVNKRLALAKPDVVKVADTQPYKFSGKRSYASCKAFLEKEGLMPKDKAVRYLFDGEATPKGTFIFRRENAIAADEPAKGAKKPEAPKSLSKKQQERLVKEEAAAKQETAAAKPVVDLSKEKKEGAK